MRSLARSRSRCSAAVRQLALQDVADAALLERLIHFAQPMHERTYRSRASIDQQLATPVAVGVLRRKRFSLGGRDRARDPRRLAVRRARSGATLGSGIRVHRRRHAFRKPGQRLRPLSGQMAIARSDAVIGRNLVSKPRRFRP